MALNVFIVIIGILAFLGGFVLIAIDAIRKYDEGVPPKFPLSIKILLPIIGVGMWIVAASFTIIPTGYTGVRIRFGQVSEKPVGNGFCWKTPFVEKIEKINNKQQDSTYSSEIWGETSNRTAVSYDGVTVTYSISGDKSAWIYSNVTDYERNLVSGPLVASAIKTASKTLDDVDATNRGKIEPLVMTTVQESIDEKYGPGVVVIHKVVIANADFEASYNEAIAAKQQAQLQYEQQQINNQKNVEQAKAEAEAAIAKANGEAQAKIIAAEAEAKANEILTKSLSADILKQRFLDKWDGKVPLVTGESNSIFDLSTFTN